MADLTFDELKAVNPYRNQSYNKSGWQKFLSALGFRTEADAWEENMAVQAAEYDASLAQKQFDTEYEDASSQNARLRMAGLNPDLDPSMLDAGQAGAMGEDPSTPMQSTGDESTIQSLFTSAVNTVIDGVSSGVGLAKSLADLRGLGLMNDQNQLNNSSKALEFAKQVGSLLRQPADANMSDHERNLMYVRQAQNVSRSFRIPRRMRQSFNQGLLQFFGSLDEQADYWNKTRQTNESKQGVARQLDSRFFGEGTIESMKIVNQGLVDLNDAYTELSTISANAHAGYEASYYEGLDGFEAAQAQNLQNRSKSEYFRHYDSAGAARAENAGNELSQQTARVTKSINSTLERMTSRLEKLANKGDIFAQVLLFGISLARMSSFSLTPKGANFGFNP